MLIFTRIKVFYQKYGIWKTAHRLLEHPLRITVYNKNVYFYVNLTDLDTKGAVNNSSINLIRNDAENHVAEKDMLRLVQLRGETVLRRMFRNNFQRGAVLWLAKRDEELISICWSVASRPVQRLPFPLTEKDVHLFDVETFPEFRGQGSASILVNEVLARLQNQGYVRAYIDCKVWNKASLSFINNTYFQVLGAARVFGAPGRSLTLWSKIAL